MRDEVKYMLMIGGAVCAAIIFMFQTFATIKWVENKHRTVEISIQRIQQTQDKQNDKLDRILEHLIKR